MAKTVNFKIDGKACTAEDGTLLMDAAKQNGVFIPGLCHIEGYKPAGSCRLCHVKINGRIKTACTTPVWEGMEIENDTKELNNSRKAIIELFFIEGNHFCPVCEKSGNCELQALAYKYQILAPRFPYLEPVRDVDATHPKLFKDHNRCILCKRCVRVIKTESGKSVFAFKHRGHKAMINIDPKMSENMTDETAQKAMDICPVGALLNKEKGYVIPIGQRKFDISPIGTNIENNE
jgi:[NiFe] hydrogenase diaphorase moiety small subunit